MTERSEDAMKAIDPNSDASAIARVRVLALTAPLSDSFTNDLERVCSIAENNTRSEASAPVIDEGMVERACDALLEALRPHIAAKYPDAVDMDITWAGATEEARAIFIPAMRAALEAGCAGLVAEPTDAMIEAGIEAWDKINEAMMLREASDDPEEMPDYDNGDICDAVYRAMARTALRGDREQGEG